MLTTAKLKSEVGQCKSVEFVLSMLLKFRSSKKWPLKINTKVQRRHQKKDNSFLQILDSNFTFNGKKDLFKAVYKIQY